MMACWQVTWNMFFMESEAETRMEAEQKVAFKMLNHIRDIIGLEKIPEKIPAPIETLDSSEIISDEDIPDEVKKLLIKNNEILRNKKIKSSKDKLSLFSKMIQCPVLPNYNISDVDTAGPLVQVTVQCSWLTLTSRGQGNNKSLAEEEAASNMIKNTLKIINKMNRDNFDIPPPTVEKDLEPVTLLRYPDTTGPGVTSVTVSSNDYLCLQSEQYLNDVIIDFYLKYLQVGRWPDNDMLKQTYIFSIYFYNRLTMKTSSANIPRDLMMHNNVKKWTKNVNIFQKDFIVIPVNECDHWFVVIVCYPNHLLYSCKDTTKKPLMIVMDSLEDGLKNTICTNLRTYLTKEWEVKMKSSKEFTVDNMPAYCPNVPQQTNLTDCGLFLLQYVESFYQNPLTSLQTPLQDLQDWFTAECITDKRYQKISSGCQSDIKR